MLTTGVTAIILTLAMPALAERLAALVPAVKAYPGEGTGAYKTGHYRNLFVEWLGHSEAETAQRIEDTFQQHFHGDGQEERIYFETSANADGTLAYITDWANNDARSEGMSYGMMIAVQLDKKREFDALWNWSKTYMLTTDPQNPSLGYFAWSMGTDGSARAVGAAPPRWRGILRHGALFRGAPLGQWPRHLQLSGRGRQDPERDAPSPGRHRHHVIPHPPR
ncbi:hypothetical protein ABENE_22235 [Asticcacaulis benevestitus DSM 16100 = ATCC BAA-896]|uniref:cellulase n=1 Tax=Asticcacaulis benevestitus DSM 16100 = ATCC BAA-896 TaxID=1121022 RepID=V4P623_9CAUL|nr:hypothetical protein ABENE_22235 [Asticcacaulis benevestitus DSM 16100 = ATCC BAA-896]